MLHDLRCLIGNGQQVLNRNICPPCDLTYHRMCRCRPHRPGQFPLQQLKEFRRRFRQVALQSLGLGGAVEQVLRLGATQYPLRHNHQVFALRHPS